MQQLPSPSLVSHNRSLVVGFFAMTIFLAVIAGLIAVTANPLVILFFLAAGAGVLLMLQPTLLLWMVLIGGLVFSGLAELYIPALRRLPWGVVLAALSLGLVATVSRMLSTDKLHSRTSAREESKILAWALSFFVIACFSTFYNLGFSMDAIIGLKGYFQVWGILLAFAWINLSIPSVNRISRALLWLAALQVPFALHQYFILAPQRLSVEAGRQLIVAQDIVVGTFVGSMGGGGGSAILTLLQVVCIVLLLALWRQKQIKSMPALTLAGFYFIPILLNETKVTFVIFPIALTLLYWDRLLKNPFRFTLASLLVAALLISVLFFYAAGQRKAGVGEYWQQTMAYNTGERGYGGYLLNRTTVYRYWLKRHGFEDINGTLIGHGAGETNDGQSGLRHNTLAMTRYGGTGIGLTGISGLLWEVGVLGTLAAIGFFYSAFRAAGRLATRVKTGFDWAVLKTAEAGIAVLAISLLHNNYFLFEIGYQTLLMLMVGIIIHYSRSLQPRIEASR